MRRSLLLLWILSAGGANAQGRRPRLVQPLPQAAGWVTRIDPAAERAGGRADSLAAIGGSDSLRLSPRVPAVLWRSDDARQGTFEMSAEFGQLSGRATAYHGVFMGGSQLDAAAMNYLYCAIAGNGTFVVRHRLGDEVHELAGRTAHAAIRRATAEGRAVNAVGWRVTAGRTSCVVNGTEVWGYTTASLVGPGKLLSTDGVVGIRVEPGVELVVRRR